MSMPALLSHFGINVARYVTTTGQIVFDGVSGTGGTYRHAEFGRVTPVAPHTFHGGEAELDDPLPTTPWWEDDEQILRHTEAMEVCFPGFAYVRPEGGRAPSWVGEINTGRGKFVIGVTLRRDGGLPAIRMIKGPRLGVYAGRRWVASKHLYVNGDLCVADRNDWNPTVHTAATATAWAAHWLAAYTEWRFARRWPTEGVHSIAS
jgi:hypothetical protein